MRTDDNQENVELVEEIMREFDYNKDGKISFEEFEQGINYQFLRQLKNVNIEEA